MVWRNVSDVSEDELKKLFGPWARKVWMDLTPVELNHAKKGPEFRAKFQERLGSSIDTEMEAITNRTAQLPVLHVYDGPYMPLLQEARELYMMGYFYSCVVTCAVTAEKILRGMFRQRLAVTWPPHALTDEEMKHLNRLEAMQVLEFLGKLQAVGQEARRACKTLLETRNTYAHGLGSPSPAAALESYSLLQAFLDGTVSVAPGAAYHV